MKADGLGMPGRRPWGALAVCSLLLASAGPARAETPTTSHESGSMDMMEWGVESFLLSEVLEYAPTTDNRAMRYDLLGWFGGAYHRLWAKAEGVQSTRSTEGETELQILYGRLISPFWDVQFGLRLDVGYGEVPRNTRALAALGVQGLAPGWFELEPALFVSQEGDVSANLTASYDLLFTQRLVAQARLETDAAVQSVPDFGVGSGISRVELGLRVRYEFWRQLGPYLGISWERRLMESADLARAAGEPVSQLSLFLGLRLWI